MRILAIQLNQPGDAILTTPALRWLMDQGHEVHVLLQPLGAELLQAMPGLASVEKLPRGSIQITRDARRFLRYRGVGFDWAVVFSQCSDRPALWARLSGAKKRTGLRSTSNAHLGRFGLINDWQTTPADAVHSAEQHLYLAGAGLDAAAKPPLEYHPPEPDRAWAHRWLHERGWQEGGYLLIHATARWPSKYWPAANFAEVIRHARARLNLPVVITSGPGKFELEFTHELRAQAKPDHQEIGTLTVSQLGALIADSGAFLGVDSMPMHLAAALGKPGVALFGPTDERVWGPWHSRLSVLRAECRCLGRERLCGAGPTSDCLAALSPETVLAELANALKNP